MTISPALLTRHRAGLTSLRQGYGGPPKLYAKAEGLRYMRFWHRSCSENPPWPTSPPTCATPSAASAKCRCLLPSPCCRWHSASRPTPAVFTLVDQVVLRTLPVTRPGELVQVSAQGTESYGGGFGDTELSYTLYRDLRDHNQVFAGMFCRMQSGLTIIYGGRSELANAELVSGTFFPQLGVRPAVGRLFSPAEDRVAGGHPVAVLGFNYWMSRFAGDPSIVGKAITVDGHPLEVIGVVQAGFEGLDLGQPPQLYVPVTMQPLMGPAWLQLDTRRFRWVQVFARLREGVTVERAQVGLQPLYQSLLRQEVADAAFATASGDTRKRFLEGRLTVEDATRGHSSLRASITTPLLILMAVAGAVLLIVCANVANLLIARGAARHRELAFRLAVGASRGQMVPAVAGGEPGARIGGLGIRPAAGQLGCEPAAGVLRDARQPAGGHRRTRRSDSALLLAAGCCHGDAVGRHPGVPQRAHTSIWPPP